MSDDDGEVFVPLKERRARAEAERAAKRARLTGAAPPAVVEAAEAPAASAPAASSAQPASDTGPARASAALAAAGPGGKVSLLEQARRAAAGGAVATEEDKQLAEEKDLLRQVALMNVPALVSAKEHAAGTVYTTSLTTDWRPPAAIRAMTPAQCDLMRKKWHILVEGRRPLSS